MLGAVLAYALLLNAFAAAAFNVQAVAAALDPLTVAATCDTSGSEPSGGPVRHQSQHQPDCTLCSSACPMGGMVQALGDDVVDATAPLAAFILRIGAHRSTGLNPPSIYLSDTDAQAPPAIG
ncbi:hypothetical protein [Dongia sp.]|uniref:hypothetical protein n=1 Tax=Dongia sp. TaxID=1977262 RepID=UPI0037512989